MKTATTLALTALLLIGQANSPVHAHHSIAIFDGKRVVKVSGTVTRFSWLNPHVTVLVEGIADGDVPAGPWNVEMSAPTALMSEGWARNSLSVGDRITLFVNPLRDAANSAAIRRGLYVGAILPDGRALGQVGVR
jgi:hypothetical protein